MRRYFVLLLLCVFALVGCDNTGGLVTSEPYGALSNGEEVTLWRLTNKVGATVDLIDYGSRIIKITMPDRDGIYDDVVVGYGDLESFESGDR